MSEEISELEMSIPDSAWTAWKHSQNVDTAGMCNCGHEGLGPSWHSRDCAGANFALTTKVQKLTQELYIQWERVHRFECRERVCESPEDPCCWPMPEGLRF